MKTAQGPEGLVIDWREGMLRDIAQRLDTLFIRAFGLRYLRLTRAVTIHERAWYLVARLRTINRTGLRLLDVGCGSAIPLLYLDQWWLSSHHGTQQGFCHEDGQAFPGL